MTTYAIVSDGRIVALAAFSIESEATGWWQDHAEAGELIALDDASAKAATVDAAVIVDDDRVAARSASGGGLIMQRRARKPLPGFRFFPHADGPRAPKGFLLTRGFFRDGRGEHHWLRTDGYRARIVGGYDDGVGVIFRRPGEQFADEVGARHEVIGALDELADWAEGLR